MVIKPRLVIIPTQKAPMGMGTACLSRLAAARDLRNRLVANALGSLDAFQATKDDADLAVWEKFVG